MPDDRAGWVPQSADDLVEKLAEYIRGCDAVIHLVGASAGFPASARGGALALEALNAFLARETFGALAWITASFDAVELELGRLWSR